MSFNAAALPVFSLVEYFWGPEAGWQVHGAVACGWEPEGGMTDLAVQGEPEAAADERKMSPAEMQWFIDFEKVAVDGKRRVVIPDLDSTDTFWQKAKKEKDAAAAAADSDKENGIHRAVSLPPFVRALCSLTS
jgi:hypothetical protein